MGESENPQYCILLRSEGPDIPKQLQVLPRVLSWHVWGALGSPGTVSDPTVGVLTQAFLEGLDSSLQN